MLYHEKQVAALCGVHCINTLLQGPYFSELDLAQIGHELDQMERQMLDDAAGPSSNLDESGMFSIQVLTKALQVWGLTAINIDSQELKQAGFEAQREEAFICNLLEHWFTIRKLDGEWWNFNSLYPAPEQLSSFYLTAYLDSLKDQGYTIFCIRGAPLPLRQGDMEGPGRWWAPDEAREAHKSAQQSRQLGRARNAMEDALARAAAGGGAITLRPTNKRSATSQMIDDDEDADLAAAIAASMGADQAGPSGLGAAAGAAQSYAAAVSQRGSSPAAAAGAAGGSDAGGMSFEDDDPELAAALAASLEEHHHSQQQHSQQQQHGQQQQHQQQQPEQSQEQQPEPAGQPDQQAVVHVPEEPAAGAEGVVTVAFRLPSGSRLSRRFSRSDTVAVLSAFVAEQMRASGELAAGRQVVLSTQFPKKVLDQPDVQLDAAGVEDCSILTVQV